MAITFQRPINVEEHPIIRKRYLVPTPTIDEVTERRVGRDYGFFRKKYLNRLI